MTIAMRCVCLAMLVVVALNSGCQNQTSLFTDSDRAASQKGRFWDGESAYQTTQSRKQSQATPFGFPTGAAQQ